MSGTVTNLVNWQQFGSNAGAHTINTGDIAGAAFSGGRCTLVLLVAANGTSGTGAPSINSVTIGGDTTLKPSGCISTWTKQVNRSFSFGNTGEVEIWTATASQSFSGLDLAIAFSNSTANLNFAILAVQGLVEPISWTTASAIQNGGGTTSPPTVTGTAISSANSIQFGIALGDGSTSAPVLASGWTADSTNNLGTTGQSIAAHKINSSAPGSNTYSMGPNTASYPNWAIALISASAGAAEGTITTHLTKASQSVHGLLNAEVGTIKTVLTKMSFALAGTDGNSETGSIVTHLRALSQSAAGTITPKESGTIVTTLSGLSMSVQGHMDAKGTIVTTLGGVSQRADAFESQNWGTITTNLTKLSQAANSAVANVVGQTTTHLSRISQSLEAEKIVTGGVVTRLNNRIGIQLHALAFEVFTGTIETNLPSGFGQNLTAQEIEVAEVITRLPAGISMSAAGEVFLEAKIKTRLGNANVLVQTTVHALQIIEGPIVTNLGAMRVHALGGKPGTPGAGPWYSWRYTDS